MDIIEKFINYYLKELGDDCYNKNRIEDTNEYLLYYNEKYNKIFKKL